MDNVHAFENISEYDLEKEEQDRVNVNIVASSLRQASLADPHVFPVQPRGDHSGDEELGTYRGRETIAKISVRTLPLRVGV